MSFYQLGDTTDEAQDVVWIAPELSCVFVCICFRLRVSPAAEFDEEAGNFL